MNTRTKKGFTLVEVVTAIGILVVVVVFTGIIFRSSIESYRIAGANAEIIQNLQTITTQLDRDFSQIRRDGLLGIRVEEKKDIRSVTQADKDKKPIPIKVPSVWMDRIYYFTTGDFQSWFDAGTRSNISRIYFGHDRDSLNDFNNIPLNQCKLARDVLLITPREGTPVLPSDCIDESYVAFASDPNAVEDYNNLLTYSVLAGITNSDSRRRLMCENVGELKIEWMNGVDSSTKRLIWSSSSETWGPGGVWPKAIKFTFTLYDSKGILKGGSRFTHIVYLN